MSDFLSNESLAFAVVILLTITATGLLFTHNARGRVALLALQYVGIFIMVDQSWPFELAIVKLIAGWIAATTIGLALFSFGEQEEEPDPLPAGQLFLLFVVLLILIAAWSITPFAMTWIPGVGQAQMTASLYLIGFGLLQLGLSTQSTRTIIGLLTALSGFEIIYAAVERSVLVAGLLAGVTLCLALAGAYLMSMSMTEGER